MKSKNKKKLLCCAAAVLILVAYTNKKKYHPDYAILDIDNGPFAEYSDGYVYIGTEEYLNSLTNIGPNDILVRDERDKEDPNMVIMNSFCITDKETRNDILEIINYYEVMNPSDWDRSVESMRLEWFCHNVSYYMNYKKDRSFEVDLNNKDEDKYDNEVLRRFLRI